MSEYRKQNFKFKKINMQILEDVFILILTSDGLNVVLLCRMVTHTYTCKTLSLITKKKYC